MELPYRNHFSPYRRKDIHAETNIPDYFVGGGLKKKNYFYNKGHSQGHRILCHLKGIHKFSMYTRYGVSFTCGSKVMAKVSFFCHRHTHTDQILDVPLALQSILGLKK